MYSTLWLSTGYLSVDAVFDSITRAILDYLETVCCSMRTVSYFFRKTVGILSMGYSWRGSLATVLAFLVKADWLTTEPKRLVRMLFKYFSV